MEVTNKYCKEHPLFDPFIESDLEYGNRDCPHCLNLINAVKPATYFHGEYDVASLVVKRVEMEIGPLSFEQFGYVRHTLFWDHMFHRYGKIDWYVDTISRTIYLTDELPTERVKDFLEMGCKVFVRQNGSRKYQRP